MPGDCAVVLFDDIQLFAKSQHSLIGIPRSRSSDTEISYAYYAIRDQSIAKFDCFVRQVISWHQRVNRKHVLSGDKASTTKRTHYRLLSYLIMRCDRDICCWYLFHLFLRVRLIQVLLAIFCVNVEVVLLIHKFVDVGSRSDHNSFLFFANKWFIFGSCMW